MSQKIGILLVGATGRMGAALQSEIQDSPDFSLVYQVSRTNLADLSGGTGSNSSLRPDQVNVLIDFSSPALFESSVRWCSQFKKALVSGTTGLSPEQFQSLENLSKETPTLWSANMSLGVSLFRKWLKDFPISEEFDFQFSETHHKHKKDAPSGTALVLKNDLDKHLKKKTPEVLVTRSGEAFGEHRLTAISADEEIEITHRALNRRIFATGALRAAKWISIQKKPGLFSMDDVIRVSSDPSGLK